MKSIFIKMRGDLMNASRAFGDLLINVRGNFSYEHPQKKQLKQHQQGMRISGSVATATIAMKNIRLSPVFSLSNTKWRELQNKQSKKTLDSCDTASLL